MLFVREIESHQVRMPGSGYWLLDSGYLILDTGFLMPDTG